MPFTHKKTGRREVAETGFWHFRARDGANITGDVQVR